MTQRSMGGSVHSSRTLAISPDLSSGANIQCEAIANPGMGVGWVLATARWRCPDSVVILPVFDLNMPLQLALTWRKDNASALLANFVAEVTTFAGRAGSQ